MVLIPIIETPRLILRAHRVEDFAPYAKMWAEPAVVRYIGGLPVSREAAWSRFLRHAGLWEYVGFGFFAIEDRETGAFLGEAGFHELHRDITPSIEDSMEAGWALTTAAHGRGIGEEAMRAALNWADRHGTGNRIACIISPENAPSLKLAAKLGFANAQPASYNGNAITLLERPRLKP